MTTVAIKVSRPDSSGLLVPMSGYVKWEAVGAPGHAPDGLVLPVPFTVKLVNGEASVQVQPTGAGWAWKVTLQLYSYAHESRHVLVPDAGTVEFTSLIEVDPSTLTPVQGAGSAWELELAARVKDFMAAVVVVTGNETRPAASSVLWIGGVVEPVNMRNGVDVWLEAAA